MARKKKRKERYCADCDVWLKHGETKKHARHATKLLFKAVSLKARETAADKVRAGDRFETQILNMIKRGAAAAMKSAGSRGTWDLMALMPTGKVRMIQAKRNGYIEPAERKKLWKEINRCKKQHVQYEVWWKPSPRGGAKKKIIKRESDLDQFCVKAFG